MKKWICLMMAVVMSVMALTACGNSNKQQSSQVAQDQSQSQGGDQDQDRSQGGNQNQSQSQDQAEPDNAAQDSKVEVQENEEEPLAEIQQEPTDGADDQGGKVLVVYYSASGNTKAVGDIIAQYTGGDTFEIIPINAYTSEDLDWTKEGSRVNLEHEDESLQDIELVSTTVENFDSYDTVFIGYPIWWQEAAWVVNRFVKDNDFTGKTVIPFCTSSSSGLGESGTHLAAMAGTGDWQEGQRFSGNASEEEVTGWLDGIGF